MSQHTWSGFYVQNRVQTNMDLNLDLNRGNMKIKGEGSDTVGKFSITGKIDSRNNVKFEKQYFSAHNITYEGQISHQWNAIKGFWYSTIFDNRGRALPATEDDKKHN